MSRFLGPFELGGLLAIGGMGRIYLGRSAADGTHAAVKVVAARAGSLVALMHEVRAMASLNHPGIVAVFDYGVVSDAEARGSDGELDPGSLWFAMELADRGTLEDIVIDSWQAARHVLLEILDALAHAHARGLVHRDLKPANVLLQRRDEGTGLLIADFGIAHVAVDGGIPDSTDTYSAPAAGTPRYMAPEQIQAQWRDQGPWTDLYALGCLAWELLTGEPAFAGDSAVAVAFAHLKDPVPPFVPRFAVPDGVEAWLHGLLAKHWRDRYARAAHAAYALARLGSSEPVGTADLLSAASDHVPTDLLPTLGTLEFAATVRLPSVELRAVRSADRRPAGGPALESVHVPPDWRRADPTGPMRGRTGLSLFGLREIPVVGREAERDMLWNALVDVASTRSARAVVVRGAEGLGKSKLLRWLEVRADELGVATVIHVAHSPLASPAAGVARAIARHLGCVGLPLAACRKRVEEACPADVARAGLADLIATGQPTLQFASPTERYAITESFLRWRAREGPLLLAIDDAQWGADAIGLVQHLWFRLDEVDAPICVVLTVSEAEIANNPLSQRRVARLAEHERTTSMSLEPLRGDDHVALVREHVGLAPQLADDLVAVAGSDTNYSLCVIADWVQRRILRPGAQGFEIAEVVVDFPSSLTTAWDARIDRFCAEFSSPAATAEALEVAAALGTEVDFTEWDAACTARGLRHLDGLMQRLIDAGFATRSESGFGFVHTALTLALALRAADRRRLADIHADCARAIQFGVATGASAAERRALHLLRAGEVRGALLELRVAVDERLATSAYDEVILLADEYLRATPNPAEEDSLVMRARRADAVRYLGDGDAAEAEAQAILDVATAQVSRRGRAEGLRVLAGLAHGRGDPALGVSRYTEAFGFYEEAHDPLGMAKCAHGRGWLQLNASRFDKARTDFARGLELTRLAGARNDHAWSRHGLAEASLYCGDVDAAEKTARQALREFELLGSRSGQGMAMTSIANVARERNLITNARAGYDDAVELLDSFGSQLVGFPLLHKTVLELTVGSDEELRDAVDRCKAKALPVAFRLVVALAEAALDGFDQRQLEALLEDPGATLHPMIFRCLQVLDRRLEPAAAATVRTLIRAARQGLDASGVF